MFFLSNRIGDTIITVISVVRNTKLVNLGSKRLIFQSFTLYLYILLLVLLVLLKFITVIYSTVTDIVINPVAKEINFFCNTITEDKC